MAKKLSRAAKVRKLLSEGMKPKDVALKLGVSPQSVYTIRYLANKKQGVGALPKPEINDGGIATVPRKRGRPAKNVIVVPAQTEKRDAQTSQPKEKNAVISGAIWIFVSLCAVIIILSVMSAK